MLDTAGNVIVNPSHIEKTFMTKGIKMPQRHLMGSYTESMNAALRRRSMLVLDQSASALNLQAPAADGNAAATSANRFNAGDDDEPEVPRSTPLQSLV